jgi:hypothetical protein
MAKTKLYHYTFTPGGAGAGTVKVPGNILLDQFLLITNTTNQTIIYNFADTTKGGTVSYSSTDTTFGQEGTTTLTLELSTTGQNSADKLAIYVEQDVSVPMKPGETFQDPVQKLRVSTPQSLIDTDFEYGIQATKWEFLGLNNNIPSYFIRTADSPITITSAGAGTIYTPTRITGTATTIANVDTTNTTGLVANSSQVYVYNTVNSAASGVFIVTAIDTLITLTGVTITGTAGQFSCSAASATLRVGNTITISGTFGGTGSITGYSNPTTYIISATNGSTTFTLVNVSTGAAIVTTTGTPTGLTYTRNSSFRYTTSATIALGTNSQASTRFGSTTVNGASVFLATSTDISVNNLNVQIGTPFNIQESGDESLADGSFLVTVVDPVAKVIAYEAKGTLTASQSFANAFTTAYIGKFFGETIIGASLPLVNTTNTTNAGGLVANGTTTVTVTTAGTHNLYVGSPIFISGATNEDANGSFTVSTVPSMTTFTFTATGSITAGVISQGATQTFPFGTQVFARPDANLVHRAQDGGVQITTTNAVYGNQAIRQTRRYFRYQSGKGMQFSTACQFKPTFDVTSITGSSTTATITTELDHGLQPGARVKVEGIIVSSGSDFYTGTFTVATVPTTNSLTYTMSGTPTDTSPAVTEKLTVESWYGAKVRSGLYDEQNGFFYEFDGQQLFAVRRSSTNQLKGDLSVCTGRTDVVGTNTQFNKELRVGDYIVIKGQSYQISRINSATSIDISPSYRAATPSRAAGQVGLQLATTNGVSTNGTTTVTVNTRISHNLQTGSRIYVYNTTDARCNGSFTVASTPSVTQFTYTTGLAAAGTATVSNIFSFTGNTSAGSNTITALSSTNGLSVGQTLVNTNLASGTLITAISGGGIATATITSGGSGFRNNRFFANVPLRNLTATGTGARANITTNASGAISAVVVTTPGSSYSVGTTVTVNAADVGGSGGGVTLTVATLTSSTLTISPAATGTAATTTINIEGAKVFAEESIVKYTKTLDTKTPSASWSIDKVNGTGPSGYIMNTNKIQMVYIDYQWYGAGYIRYGMRARNGDVYYCHKYLHNNFLTEAYMRSGNIPARFEVNTNGPVTYLTADLTNIATTMSVNSTADFPNAGRLRVESELIDYTGKTSNSFTGLTRGVSGGSAAASHTGTVSGANGQCSVILTTSQLSPALSHWGVSVIMDGRFDEDQSYVFVTPKQTAAFINPGATVPLMSIRVAPSIDTGIPRPFGVRYLLNRMQLKLKQIGIITNSHLLIQVRLNCTSPIFRNDYWLVDGVGSGSLAQVIYHNTSDIITGGDQIFAFFVDSTSPTQFTTTTQELDLVKDLGTSILSGDGVYPDGPEVLTIFATNLGNSVSATIAAAPTNGNFTVNVADSTGIKPGMFATTVPATSVAPNAQVISNAPTGATNVITLSRPNVGTSTGTIVFEETATVYARLSWTEAQA